MYTDNNYNWCIKRSCEDIIYKEEFQDPRGFETVEAICQECEYSEVIRMTEPVPPNLQYMNHRLSETDLEGYLVLLSNKLVGLEFRHLESDATYRIKGVTLFNHEGASMPAVMYAKVEEDNDTIPLPYTRTLLEWLDGRFKCNTPLNINSLSEQVKSYLGSVIKI